MILVKTLGLFIVTAIAEIIGCYLPYLWLKKGGSAWLLIPGIACLLLFAWLLTQHPAAAGRIYAAYGGVYVAVALAWLWAVEGVAPSRFDAAGVALIVAGTAVIVWGGWQADP
jgi:small multidrug resistance family-3 protein